MRLDNEESFIIFEYNLLDNPPTSDIQSDEISLFDNNFPKLQSAIDIFNSEIEWDGMWTLDIAKHRLENNWKLIVLNIDSKICGWYWLDVDNKITCNLFVSKSHSNYGWGTKLIKDTLDLSQRLNMDKVRCEIDSWNTKSIKIHERCGYKRVQI